MNPRLEIWTRQFTSCDGGMGTWTEQAARFAARCGWRTRVGHFTSVPLPADGLGENLYLYDPIELPPFERGGLPDFLAMGRAVRAHRNRLRDKDLLLTIFGEPSDLKFWLFSSAASLARPYAMLIGCRTFEDHTRESFLKDLRNRFYRRWMNGARGILADGEDIKRELAAHGVDASKVRVMYAAIDTGRYHPLASPEPFWRLLEEQGIERRPGPLLLYCGRLLFMNRPLDFPRIVERIPHCWAVVIGDGPDRPEMEKQALKLPGRMNLLGYQSEAILASAFCAADLCLFPLGRMIAGISLVVPKAMACGAAVITNDVADMARLVRPEENGWLCTEGDIEGWTEAVRRLLADSSLRSSLGRRARATIESEWTETVREREYRQWFDSLIDAAGTASGGNLPG